MIGKTKIWKIKYLCMQYVACILNNQVKLLKWYNNYHQQTDDFVSNLVMAELFFCTNFDHREKFKPKPTKRNKFNLWRKFKSLIENSCSFQNIKASQKIELKW